MFRQKVIILVTLFMTAFICTTLDVQASALKDRMLARVPAINNLKDKGLIGENNTGYLEYRTGARPQQELIKAENQDRKTVYAEIARKQNVDITLVGQRRAKQIRDIGGQGHWFQQPDGTWYKK
jgi:uncharacterized protein